MAFSVNVELILQQLQLKEEFSWIQQGTNKRHFGRRGPLTEMLMPGV